MTDTIQKPLQNFLICHDCDLLLRVPEALHGMGFKCPRCSTPVKGRAETGLAKPVAAVLAGLIFFWPAAFLPILRLNILGVESSHTMIGAVRVMADSGMALVAFMVLFCSMLAPFLEFVLLGAVLLQVLLGRNLMGLPAIFRFYTYLGSWSMLEVYMIGLLVSVIKLMGMASVEPGVGLLCFSGMMLTGIAVKVTLDNHAVWKRIENLCRC